MSTIDGGRRSWVHGDVTDRMRFAAVQSRLHRCGPVSLVVAVPQLLTARWVGAPLFLLTLGTVVTVATLFALGRRRPRVLVELAGTLLLIAGLGASVRLSGGASSPLLPLVAVVGIARTVGNRSAVLWSGTVLAGLATLAAAVTAAPLAPAQVPPSWVGLVSVTALLVLLGATVHAVRQTDGAADPVEHTDPLTGLGHHTALEPTWRRVRLRDSGARRATGILVVDLDHFRSVNQTHGHAHGDLVLRELAHRIWGTVRPADIAIRMDGDQVVVLLPGASRFGALAAAERLRGSVADRPLAGVELTVSIGAAATRDDTRLGAVLGDAREALGAAKHQGRNRVVLAGFTSGTSAALADLPMA